MGDELYHNTLHCIIAERLAVGRIVSQYSSLYCDRGKAWTVLQYSHRAHDTAKLGARQGAECAAGCAGRAGRRWGAGAANARARAGVRAQAGARAQADSQARRGTRSAGGRRAQAGRRQRSGQAQQAQEGRRHGRRCGRAARRGLAGSGARGVGVPVRVGWACWLVSYAKLVHCSPGLVLTQFFDRFDSVLFLSHEMNTVHCKINLKFFF